MIDISHISKKIFEHDVDRVKFAFIFYKSVTFTGFVEIKWIKLIS